VLKYDPFLPILYITRQNLTASSPVKWCSHHSCPVYTVAAYSRFDCPYSRGI